MTRPHGTTFTFALAAIAVDALRRAGRSLRHRWSVRRLAEFDDRMLRDIGLRRGDVVAALELPLHLDPSTHLAELRDGRPPQPRRTEPVEATPRAEAGRTLAGLRA